MLYLAAVCQAPAQTLSIDSCYALALNNFPMIKQYELIEKSREYTLSNAGKAYLPQVSLTAIGGYIIGGLPTGEAENSSDVKFIGLAQINQTIWDGGATKTQKEIIEASAESEKASVEVALYELRSRVNQLYFGILMTDEQLAQLVQRETVLNNNADRIRKMNENGFAYKTDLDEISVEQLKLSQQKTELEYVKEGYMQMLSLLAGIEINGQTHLEKPGLSDFLLDSEISRPELSMYESQRNLVNAWAGMQRVSNMPKIGLLGAGVLIEPGMSLGPGSLSSLGVVGLSASWNISGLYKNANEKNLNQVELAKINLQEETFLFNTNLQTTQARANLKKQQAILVQDQEIVNLRQSIREGYQLKYDNGMSSLLDLLDASEKESEAKTQKALHEMQLLMTLYEYKTMTGN